MTKKGPVIVGHADLTRGVLPSNLGHRKRLKKGQKVLCKARNRGYNKRFGWAVNPPPIKL